MVANWRALGRLAPGAACGAVVKADAYGLGMAPIARALHAAGCRVFFVAYSHEGAALRMALSADSVPSNAAAEIFVFDGHPGDTLADYERFALTPVLGTAEAVAIWARHGRDSGKPRAALMIDTGITRLGLGQAELDALLDSPEGLGGLELAAVMSHLACADRPDDALNARQRALFEPARARFPGTRASLANSAGIFLGPDYHYDLVRPGAALYGLSAVKGRPNPMTPVVRLQAKILQLRDVDTESPVGYGATRLIPAGRTLATVAMGYADGLSRALSNRGSGRIGDVPVPIVGRVSMDLSTFDVTGVAPELVRPGRTIDLIDQVHDADALADEAGTIGYEILSRLGPRVRRDYHHGGAGPGGDT